MDTHVLDVLEFARVRERVASDAAFSVGREAVLALEPSNDIVEVRRRQQLTAEARLLDQQGISIPFGGAADVRPLVGSAAKGHVLEPSDLLAVSRTLHACGRARTTVFRLADRLPMMVKIAERIDHFDDVVGLIERAIDDAGEVADAASPALASTRRELALARQRLDSHARSALESAVRQGFAQEALLTERNGRVVIPIKADFRGRIPGIVHDVSSSGATVFLEPMGVINAGNDVRELELAEDREVRRILAELTSYVGARSEDAVFAITALGELDCLSALARFGARIKAGLPGPGDSPDWLTESGTLVLVRARHPLLPGSVVPIDITMATEGSALLITGPNTGGKTVALKTVGLLTLMAQSGMPVPCDELSRFVVFRQVFADIGDEQSIQQSLSTFSAHMRNVRHVLEHAGTSTLVLLDELGAGTDPLEGAALARAVLDVLLERGCTIIATTHHGELKAFASNDPRLENASVEFDVASLSPTYHLTIGVPGQSNALAIARRLGIDDAVVERAERNLTPQHLEMEDLLEKVRLDRRAAAEERDRELAARREAEEIRLDLARKRDEIDRERARTLGEAAREAEDELTAFRKELSRARGRSGEREYNPAEAAEVLKALDAQLATLRRRSRPSRTPVATVAAPLVSPGDRVRVQGFSETAQVLDEPGSDGKVEVQVGNMRMRTPLERIERVIPAPTAEVRNPVPSPSAIPVPTEIDLRGWRAGDAIDRLEEYIDSAFRAGQPFVRIIHGKGTGALRAAIREHLGRHPLVRRLETPDANAGGEGVTVAILAG